jgi:hypothetical protein
MRGVALVFLSAAGVCCGSGATSVPGRDGGTPSNGEDAIGVTPEGRPNPICDGSQSLRLRIYYYSNPTSNLRGSTVRIENGFPSFGLDGQCTYYLNGGWLDLPLANDLGWRYGSLPDDAREELDSGVPLSHLSDLQDCLPDNGLFDVDPVVISSAESFASCRKPGPRLSKALAIVTSRAAALWTNAREMVGSIRFSAAAAADDGSIKYQWPLAEPLATFVIPENVSGAEYEGFSAGVSSLVSDPARALKLRQLRGDYLSDRASMPARFTDGQLMSDGITMAYVYMRDALPYEDDRGLWP